MLNVPVAQMTVNVAEEAVRKDLIREDFDKIQSIMQFLHSRKLEKTLAQLTSESDLMFIPVSGQQGNVLDIALDEFWSRQEKSSACETEKLIFPVPGVCVTSVEETIENVHGTANPTTACWHPSRDDLLVSGAADSNILVHELSSKKILETIKLASPVLSSEWTREALYVGCMGGELYRIIFDDEFKVVQVVALGKPHGVRRIVSIRASRDGETIGTVAKDSTVHFFNHNDSQPSRTPLRFQRDVSAVCWLDDQILVVAEIENPILTVWKFSEEKWNQIGDLCMNLSPRDPRTVYTTLGMSWNEKTRLLAACTNRNSVLLFAIPERLDQVELNLLCPTKTLYGMSLGAFDTPNIEFSEDGSYVYVSSDLRVMVFELRSGHNVFDVPVSLTKSIRCMRRHKLLDQLACVSFDRTLTVIR